ncbi:MAG: DUF4474 domain-containing protein [Clostridiales bacterium]|nr:DUF4474 domain-containing protein [Clostridiales bacterium]
MKKYITKTLAVIFSLLTVFSSLGAVFALAAGESENAAVNIIAETDTVTVGKSIKISASVTGTEEEHEITWTSSDPGVVSVSSDGTVKGVSVGKAVITASTRADDKEIQSQAEMYCVKKSTPIRNLLSNYNFFSYKYSFKDDYIYTDKINSWQAFFGYAKIYDLLAPYMFMEYDYVRVYFEYEGQDKMVQLWKGQYGLFFFGCETGYYSKPHTEKKDGVLTFYKRPDDKSEWCRMQTTLWHDSKRNGDYERVFTTPDEITWWSTGFKRGRLKKVEPAKELRQTGVVTFDNEEVAALFTQGLIECGFTKSDSRQDLKTDSFYVDGASVYYSWQDISQAEATMGVKRTANFLFAANAIAMVLGIALLIFNLLSLIIIGLIIL